jgi:hypothetical protein
VDARTVGAVSTERGCGHTWSSRVACVVVFNKKYKTMRNAEHRFLHIVWEHLPTVAIGTSFFNGRVLFWH